MAGPARLGHEFDDKLNSLIAWLDDFVKRNPKNGK